MRILVLFSLIASHASSKKERRIRSVKVDHGSEQAVGKIAAKDIEVADAKRRKVRLTYQFPYLNFLSSKKKKADQISFEHFV